jgi:hypothetical protein
VAGENPAGIQLVGTGGAGPIALHAAALEPRIRQVTLEQSLLSWTTVVQTPITTNQLTNVVPGVLAVYDLPELAALVAPRALTVRAAVDPNGKAVSQAQLAASYGPCRTAYEKQKAEKQLRLEAAP